MYRIQLHFIILLLVAFRSLGQQPIDGSADQTLYRQAEKYFHLPNSSVRTDRLALRSYEALINTLQSHGNFSDTLTDSFRKSGILQLILDNRDKAKTAFANSIDNFSRHGGKNDSLLFQPFLYLGSLYYEENKLDSARYYYLRAEKILDAFPLLPESERLYNKFGALYYETGEYRKSIPYFKRAAALLQARDRENTALLVNYQNNEATALLKSGDYRGAMAIFRRLLFYRIQRESIYLNMATAYIEMDSAREAIECLRRVPGTAPVKLNAMTRAYLSLDRPDSAAFFNQSALSYFAVHKPLLPATDEAMAFKYAGDIALSGSKQLAAAYYQQAIGAIIPGFVARDPGVNPPISRGLQSFAALFDLLAAKGRALAGADPQPATLVQALSAYETALELAAQVDRDYSSDEARFVLKQKVSDVCGRAVTLSVRLYELTGNRTFITKAFMIAENNKASVLQSGLRELELSRISGLPVALLAAEKNLKFQLAHLSLAISRNSSSLERDSLQRQWENHTLLLSAVQRKLDDIPAYHKLHYYAAAIDVDYIRRNLGNKDGILTYYYFGHQLFSFYITSEDVGVVSTPLSPPFFSAVTNLRRQLESPLTADPVTLNGITNQLYRVLIAPVFSKIHDKLHLIIIPHNQICYIPFELLNRPGDKSPLLTEFVISYNYAAGFLSNEQAAGGISPYQVLAMAPFDGSGGHTGGLPYLPGSGAEIAGLPGQQLRGAAATKQAFLDLSGHYPVIHLATHAIANDPAGTYIEFYHAPGTPDSSDRLYDQEIYTLDLSHTRLIVLSACETGNGKLVNGEGIVSLSRAFSYAGCASVITSLWKADDRATALILQRMHEYLQKGSSGDQALQKAKMDYLSNPDVPAHDKLPFYWAHLAYVGNRNPVIAAHHSTPVVLIIFSLLLIASLIALVLRHKKNRLT